MIFTVAQADILRREGEMLICRPLFRRDGRPIAYKVGQIVSIQPGRFKPHAYHAVIKEMTPRTVGELRNDPACAWEMPAEWGDAMEVFDMHLVALTKQCRQCAGRIQELA